MAVFESLDKRLFLLHNIVQIINMLSMHFKIKAKGNILFFRFSLSLILNLLLFTRPIIAQINDLKFKHINYEQGLSNSTIEAITQDSRGFIWIGTRDGLNKYNGYTMSVYLNKPGDNQSISDNYIQCLYEDKQKTLWVCTTNGLNRYNQKTNNFKSYIGSPVHPESLSNNNITCILEDHDGQLWISTKGGGINIFNRENETFKHLRHNTSIPGSLSSDTVNFLFKDSKGNIWAGMNNGLNLYNPVTHSFSILLKNKITNIKCITEHTDGRLWLGTEDHGLQLFDPVNQTISVFRHSNTDKKSLGSDMIFRILKDHLGNIWIGTINGGLNRFNPQTNTFDIYTDQPADPTSLSQRTISSLFEDHQYNLWIGTHRGGLNLYSPQAEKFQTYRQEATKNSISYNDVKTFCEDHKGRIWIGTDGGGLNLYDHKIFHNYKNDPYNANSLGSDAILDVTEDKEHNLWIGTWGAGLNLLIDASSGTFKKYRKASDNPNTISSDFVQKIYQDRTGKLWVATYFGGLNLFDPVSQKFTRVIDDPSGKTKLYGNNVVSINEDQIGNLWIGTDDGGLNCYLKDSKKFMHYFHNENKKPDIRVIFSDNKGRLWIGQSGLYYYDQKQDKFKLFTNKAGLDHEFIKGITQDKQGNLWISTSNGLTKLNPENLGYTKYNISDGLQGLEFEVNAYMKTHDGQLFFGGVNGFNTFYPENIKGNSYIPPVYITGFQVFNRDMNITQKDSPLKEDISLTNNIKLNYRQSTISFTFAALNYVASDNNKYAYRLVGFENNWNENSTERKAVYTNLDPGEYTFQVKGSNNDGLWNEKGASINIVITPPFWGTWWFRLLIILIILFSVFAYTVHRRNLQLKKLEEKKREELHQLQLQFFTNISHEFRTPLTLILGPLEKLLKDDVHHPLQRSYKMMYRNAKRLMNLINELMDFRKAESGVLHLRVMPGNLNVFLNEIADEFSEWGEQKNIQFTIVNNQQLTSDIYFDRQILEKILLNLINNAFKYTNQGGEITVKLLFSSNEFIPTFENELIIKSEFVAEKYFYILVADTGIGISKDSISHLFQRYYRIASAHLGSGIGLAFVKSLTLLHKGFIQVYSERNRGTEILVALPLGEENYSSDEKWMHDEKEVQLESINYDWSPLSLNNEVENLIAKQTSSELTKHILIVDDNSELRSFLKDSLGNMYHIIEANDGREAFEKAKQMLPDLIVSDIMMPGMNGLDLCKIIKEDKKTKDIPIILLTAKDALESRIEGIESGADFYFSKPVSINLLLLTIRNIFIQDEKLKEKYSRDYQSEMMEMMDSEHDKEFMTKLVSMIESQLVNPELDVEYLCKELFMSHTKLYELIKGLTGQSIIEFIRTIRLNNAMQIMLHENVSLSEIMFRVGIQTQSYFSKAFKKEFGKTPSQFLKDLNKQSN